MKTALLIVLAVCFITTALPGLGATAYTNPMDFQTAVNAQSFQFTTTFDTLSTGYPADNNGMLSISAVGSGSSGTQITLPPVAVDTNKQVSTPYTLGTSVGNGQFLAGNSDIITFTLSRPVNAVGLYLIGNPSPTGTPAIPFWKMHINAGSGFDALSATDPYQQLGNGNDVYFIGVVSTTEPFTTVDLFSDNDPAAVFSFNADNVIVAANVPEVSISSVKALSSGDALISNIPITRAHSDRFNVENSDRTSGVAVLGSGASRGQNVSIWGTVTKTGDDEMVLNLVHLLPQDSSTPPKPLGMNTRAIGGSTTGMQIGCAGSTGLNNIGLDVAVWGKITDINSTTGWITIDDGTGRTNDTAYKGIKVTGALDTTPHTIGQYLLVTGSSSLYKSGTAHYPLIRVANPDDILTLQ